MIREQDRLAAREQRIERTVRQAVRVFGPGLQRHQVDDVDEANSEIRSQVTQQINGGQSFRGWHVTATGDNDVRVGSLIRAGPVPDADAGQRLGQQRIVEQVNLPDRQVVGWPPATMRRAGEVRFRPIYLQALQPSLMTLVAVLHFANDALAAAGRQSLRMPFGSTT